MRNSINKWVLKKAEVTKISVDKTIINDFNNSPLGKTVSNFKKDFIQKTEKHNQWSATWEQKTDKKVTYLDNGRVETGGKIKNVVTDHSLTTKPKSNEFGYKEIKNKKVNDFLYNGKGDPQYVNTNGLYSKVDDSRIKRQKLHGPEVDRFNIETNKNKYGWKESFAQNLEKYNECLDLLQTKANTNGQIFLEVCGDIYNTGANSGIW